MAALLLPDGHGISSHAQPNCVLQIFKCNNEACPRPGNYKSYGSATPPNPACERPGCGGTMNLERYASLKVAQYAILAHTSPLNRSQACLVRRLPWSRHSHGYHVDGCGRHGRRPFACCRKLILSPTSNIGTFGCRRDHEAAEYLDSAEQGRSC